MFLTIPFLVNRRVAQTKVRGEVNDFVRKELSTLLGSVLGSEEAPPEEPPEGFVAVVREVLVFAAGRIDAARAAGALLGWSRKEGLDDRLIAGAAEVVRAGIAENFDVLADTITPLLKRNAGWQGIFVGRGTVERLLRGAQEELQRVQADPRHDMRLLLAERLAVLASRLSGEPGGSDTLADRVRTSFRDILTDPVTHGRVSRFAVVVMHRLRAALLADSSGVLEGLTRVEDVLTTQLRENREFRRAFNRGVAGLVSSLIARSGLIEGVTGYLAGLLRNTDEREFVGRVEDAVWNDLQYIRVNGAVVGGIVGILLAVIAALIHR